MIHVKNENQRVFFVNVMQIHDEWMQYYAKLYGFPMKKGVKKGERSKGIFWFGLFGTVLRILMHVRIC